MGYSAANRTEPRPGAAGCACLLLSLSLPCTAAAGASPPPLFTQDALLSVRLEGPLTTLMRERSDTEYLDGLLTYTGDDGVEQALDVKLRARGRFRRKDDTCAFPPVRLNFRKGQVDGTLFDGVDKLKLVTHCERSDTYDRNVVKEYLAYRILNALTDYSFRVRLLQIEYADTERDGDTQARYGFLIEDDDLLEERLGLSHVELPRIGYEQLEPAQASLVAVFQYLIGNTDFSMVAGPKDDVCCHNIVLFSADRGGYIPIPYDFDLAGIVDARYAAPNPRFRIGKVTTRLYRGHCSHNPQLPEAVAEVVAAREEAGALIDTVPGLEQRWRDRVQKFLDGFYREMADPREVQRRLLEKCSGL